ncbi:MAG: hypothetical protein D6732_00750 [Methanobacteriota archaeon]|nr:MAG: hypothetical protein D6732_00750 [Euryarchaeota archaeon]
MTTFDAKTISFNPKLVSHENFAVYPPPAVVSLLCTLLFGLWACTPEETISSIHGSLPWHESLHSINEFDSASPSSQFDRGGQCQCSYRVINIELSNPVGFPNDDICFWSYADCDPTNPWECTYLKGLYNSFYPDCVDIINESCVNIWESIPSNPYEVYSFNCFMDKFSSIPIAFGGVPLSLDNCLSYSFYENASITFEIYCQEIEANCGGLGWSSGPITLSFSNNQPGDTETQVSGILSLGGKCGCTPTFLH